MNQRKLHLEIMRAILRSSSLSYDEAFPVVSSLASTISESVLRREQEVEAKKLEELKKKLEEQRKRNELQKIST